MIYKNIDIVFNASGNVVYEDTPPYINQYSTNYKIRVGFTAGVEENVITKAIINNGKNLPARILYQTNMESIDANGFIISPLETYSLTIYDTQNYCDTLSITITGVKKEAFTVGTEIFEEDKIFNHTLYIPMVKSNYNKIIPTELADDTALNSILQATVDMRKDINAFIDRGGSIYMASENTDPETVVLRDKNGRAKVEDPSADIDAANKRYVLSVDSSNREYTDAQDNRLFSTLNSADEALGVRITAVNNNLNAAIDSLESELLNEISDTETSLNNTINSVNVSLTNKINTKAAITYVDNQVSSAKSYTDTKVAALVDSSPDALNTLNELANALGDDANFATTINNNLAKKLDKSGGVMSGEITIGQGDGKGIQLGSNGRINGTILNSAGDVLTATGTILGLENGTSVYFGHGSANLNMRGNLTRPKYNGKEMALYSDTTDKATVSYVDNKVATEFGKFGGHLYEHIMKLVVRTELDGGGTIVFSYFSGSTSYPTDISSIGFRVASGSFSSKNSLPSTNNVYYIHNNVIYYRNNTSTTPYTHTIISGTDTFTLSLVATNQIY